MDEVSSTDDKDIGTCPFHDRSPVGGVPLCLARPTHVIEVSPHYAENYCLTEQHTDCYLFMHAEHGTRDHANQPAVQQIAAVRRQKAAAEPFETETAAPIEPTEPAFEEVVGVAPSGSAIPIQMVHGSTDHEPEPSDRREAPAVLESEGAGREPTAVEPRQLEPTPVERASLVEWEAVPAEQNKSFVVDEAPIREVPVEGVDGSEEPDQFHEMPMEALPGSPSESADSPPLVAPPLPQAPIEETGEEHVRPFPVPIQSMPLADRPVHDVTMPDVPGNDRLDDRSGAGTERDHPRDDVGASAATMSSRPVIEPGVKEKADAAESLLPSGPPAASAHDRRPRVGPSSTPVAGRRILLLAAVIALVVIAILLLLALVGRGSHPSEARTPPEQPAPVTGAPSPTMSWHFLSVPGPVHQVIVLISNRAAAPVTTRIIANGSLLQRVRVPAHNAAEVDLPPRDMTAQIVVRANGPILAQRVVMSGKLVKSSYGVPGP